MDKDHAALEAASCIFGDRGGYVRHELQLAEQAGVDEHCHASNLHDCSVHILVFTVIP